MNEYRNYLGLDWGVKKIGVALAHSETRVAVPYTILSNDTALFSKLEGIIDEEEVGTVVIGVPRYEGKEEIHPAKTFGGNLQKTLGIGVEYTDEMFTTKLAQASLKLLGGKAVGEADDAEAAKILLQGWMDAREL